MLEEEETVLASLSPTWNLIISSLYQSYNNHLFYGTSFGGGYPRSRIGEQRFDSDF